MHKTSWAVVAVVLAVIAGIFAYYRWDELAGGGELAERPVSVPQDEEEADAAPRIRHPLPTPVPEPPPPREDAETESAEPQPPPAPPLGESDAPLREDLGAVIGERPVEAFLKPERIVANAVVTVDNLGRDALSLRHWPVKHVEGPPAVEKRAPDGGDERPFLVAGNAERYDPYVEALRTVDAKRLVDLYVRYYPLFQQAYEDLGYPDRYFNDRLIEVLDHLLATPEVAYPIELVRPEVLYEFADPELEALSWGRKTLIRMGPSHMATVKAKLREIRAAIVARAPAANGG